MESEKCQLIPIAIPLFQEQRYFVNQVACGDDHCVAIGMMHTCCVLINHIDNRIITVTVSKKDNSQNVLVYAWGDDTYLQLGSCDTRTRSTPCEVYTCGIDLSINNIYAYDYVAGEMGNEVFDQILRWKCPFKTCCRRRSQFAANRRIR